MTAKDPAKPYTWQFGRFIDRVCSTDAESAAVVYRHIGPPAACGGPAAGPALFAIGDEPDLAMSR